MSNYIRYGVPHQPVVGLGRGRVVKPPRVVTAFSGSASLTVTANIAAGYNTHWLNRVTIFANRTGTNSITVNPASAGTGATVVGGNPFTPTAGRLLVAFYNCPVSIGAVSGWTQASNGSWVANSAIYVRSKTAAGGDTATFPLSADNYPLVVTFFEFPAGTTLDLSASSAGQASNGGGVNPALSSLTTSNLILRAVGKLETSTSTAAHDWTWASAKELVDTFEEFDVTNGIHFGLAYDDRFFGTSAATEGADATGGTAATTERLSVAFTTPSKFSPVTPVSVTATIAAAGSVTADFTGTSALTATATIASTGSTGLSSTASVSTTATIAAAGVANSSSTASNSTTATITSAGTTGLSSTASVSTTATIASAGIKGLSSTAAVSTTATITSAGVVGKSSGASLTATATITSAGTVTAGFSGSATRAITATITTAGSTGLSSTATNAISATIVAAGVVGKSSGASLSVTATISVIGGKVWEYAGTNILDFEGLTNGASLPFQSVDNWFVDKQTTPSTPATATSTTVPIEVIDGLSSAKLHTDDTSAAYLYSFLSVPHAYLAARMRIPSAPEQEFLLAFCYRQNGDYATRVTINPSGYVTFYAGDGASLTTSTPIALPGVYDVKIEIFNITTATPSVSFWLRDRDDNDILTWSHDLPGYDVDPQAGAGAGGDRTNYIAIGGGNNAVTTSGHTYDLILDSLRVFGDRTPTYTALPAPSTYTYPEQHADILNSSNQFIDSPAAIGLAFEVDSPVTIYGVRVYLVDESLTVATPYLWDRSTGTALKTGSSVNCYGGGWHDLIFATPASLTPGTVYVAGLSGVDTATGYMTLSYVSSATFSVPPIHPASGVSAAYQGFGFTPGTMPTESIGDTYPGVELLSGPPLATASRPVTVTITSAGATGTATTASRSTTATITAAGVKGVSSGATVPIAATITTAGSKGSSTTASLTATATIATVGSKVVSSTASVATTATISAVGANSRTGTASLTTTATISSVGTTGVSSGSTLTATDTITATGTTGLSSAASRPTTATITAAGSVSGSAGSNSGKWWFSGTNWIRMSAGSFAGNGAWTMAVLARPDSANSMFMGAYDGSTAQANVYLDTSHIYGPSDFSSGFGTLTTDGTQFYVIVITKPAGSAHYRMHYWPYATDESGSFTHGESAGAANHADFSTPATDIYIGRAYSNVVGGNGVISVAAAWDRALSDSEIDSLKSIHLSPWAALSPKFLVPLNDWDGVSNVTDRAGTSTFTSLTGSIDVVSSAPSFDFTITPPPTSSLTVTATLAAAGSIGLSSGATSSTTSTITTTGTTGKSSGSSLSVTATITAAGSVSTGTTYHLFDGSAPSTDVQADPVGVNLGVEFIPTAPAWVTKIGFFQPSTGSASPSTAARQVALFQADSNTSGTQLSATTTGTTPVAGWNWITLATPIEVTAGTHYRAVTFHPGGQYAADPHYFDTGSGATDQVHGPVTTPKYSNALGSNQGQYAYDTVLSYPGSAFGSANYWTDIEFTDSDPSGHYTGTASLTATATSVASGQVGKSSGASSSITATTSATGQAGLLSGASVSATATITAAGQLGKTSGSSLAVTDTISAAGQVATSSGASLTETTTITTAGVVGKSSGAALAATATIAAAGNAGGTQVITTATITTAGNVGTSSGAALTVTASRTATGSKVLSTGSTSSITATLSATGQLGKVGSTTRPVTATITTAGVAASSTGASSSVNATINSAGQVGALGAATLTITSSLTATGLVGKSSTASRNVTATISSSGTRGTTQPTSLTTTASISAAGFVATSSGSTLDVGFSATTSGKTGLSGSAALQVTATVTTEGDSGAIKLVSLSDNVLVTDHLGYYRVWVRSINENITVTDDLVAEYSAGGRTWTVNISDDIHVTDSINSHAVWVRSVSEAVNVAETLVLDRKIEGTGWIYRRDVNTTVRIRDGLDRIQGGLYWSGNWTQRARYVLRNGQWVNV